MSAEIYALTDPRTGTIRYIGKANNAAKRLASHLRDSNRRNTPVYCWIRKLAALGLTPGIRVLCTVDAAAWPEAEKREIASARARGEDLLNLADGGDEPHCPAETRRKNGASVAAAIHNHPKRRRIWELKRNIGQYLRAGLISESAKEKLRYAARKSPHLFGEFAHA